MVERNISKDSWRVNLPAELMSELKWRQGDTLVFEIDGDKLIVKNKQPREINIIPEVTLANREKKDKKPYVRPKKKTPCRII